MIYLEEFYNKIMGITERLAKEGEMFVGETDYALCKYVLYQLLGGTNEVPYLEDQNSNDYKFVHLYLELLLKIEEPCSYQAVCEFHEIFGKNISEVVQKLTKGKYQVISGVRQGDLFTYVMFMEDDEQYRKMPQFNTNITVIDKRVEAEHSYYIDKMTLFLQEFMQQLYEYGYLSFHTKPENLLYHCRTIIDDYKVATNQKKRKKGKENEWL